MLEGKTVTRDIPGVIPWVWLEIPTARVQTLLRTVILGIDLTNETLAHTSQPFFWKYHPMDESGCVKGLNSKNKLVPYQCYITPNFRVSQDK